MGITCLLLFISCSHQGNEHHGIIDKIEKESKDYHGISISSENYIDHVDLIEVTENNLTFLIPERKGKLKSYACSDCHSNSLNELHSKDQKKAHWNIKLNHANQNVMNCITCHNGDDMDNLKSLTGNTIDFDQSYQLCSQCHNKQFNDWSGGAHGKRIGSWAPPRASLTCVNCHNPHSPHFEPRWPKRYNTHTANERK